MTVTLLHPVVVAAKEGTKLFVRLPAGATVQFEYSLDDFTDVTFRGETYIAMCQDLLDAAQRTVPVES
jgi:hypothetical protein